LEPDLELAIFRIAQEGLRNAERHSSARNVNVEFTYKESGVILEILDDGEGFKNQHLARGEGGLGLIGMHERARLIGATLQIDSQPDGTRVVIEAPIKSKGASKPPTRLRIPSLVGRAKTQGARNSVNT
jgi:signal transduction histidine kinase